MAENQNIILLQENNVYRNTLASGLTDYGFCVRDCGGIWSFRHLYTTHPAPVVVLVGIPSSLVICVAKVREITPSAAIIVLGHNLNAVWRIRIMAAGADGCHSVGIHIHELTAILTAWVRRAGEVLPAPKKELAVSLPAPPSATHRGLPTWQLRANARVLTCPDGRTLPLTGMESSFLRRLATSEGRLVHRQGKPAMPSLPIHGTYSVEAGHHPAGEIRDDRNIEVLVSRLRRKARHAGIHLPLCAVRGCGYLFAERLDMSTKVVAA